MGFMKKKNRLDGVLVFLAVVFIAGLWMMTLPAPEWCTPSYPDICSFFGIGLTIVSAIGGLFILALINETP